MEPLQEVELYVPPDVIYEGELEVRAGSPLGIPNPLDLFGSEQ